MTITKEYCDRCKAELPKDDFRMYITRKRPASITERLWPMAYPREDKRVLCHDCLNDYELFMRNQFLGLNKKEGGK